MSIHDIYDVQKRRTGEKFSDKASHLRTADEYSLSVLVFITFFNKLIVFSNTEKTEFHTLSVRLDENESSVRACERAIYKNTGLEINNDAAKIFATKCVGNDFFDFWLYKLEYEKDLEVILRDNDAVVVDRDVFEQMLENNDFLGCVEKSDIISIFGPKEGTRVRPLIIKSNLY